jgi:uncharacterized protein
MGWGGARPNSGPKRNGQVTSKTVNAVADAARVPVSPEAKKPIPAPIISMDALMALMEANKDRARQRKRELDWCPYHIDPSRFGPVADHIARKQPKKTMAMDNNLQASNGIAVQAWMAGGLLSNVISEGLTFLGYPYLSELAQRPEFRLFAEIPAEEMTRKWTKFRGSQDESTKEKNRNADNDNEGDRQRARFRAATDAKPRTDARNKEIEAKIKELQDYEVELKVKGWFKAAAIQDKLFGIGHLMLDLKDANIRQNRNDPELSTSIGNGRDRVSRGKLKGAKGCLRGIRTIEPIWVYPTTYNAQNPMLESWYDPQVWYVMGSEIHKTRLLSFIGRPVPDILKPAYAFGGLSMTQMGQPYVDIWLRTRESVGEMVHAFSIIGIATNMATTTMPGGSGGGNGDVLARIALFNYLRDNQGTWAYDKNTEDIKNIAIPLSGLPELQAQSQEHMCSVARIPVVKFTGVQPMGLNATSEGELRAFEETTAGGQEHLFRDNLTTVYDVMQYSLWGQRDPDITYDFVPLREETPKELAEIRKLDAETAQIRIDSGVISQEEERTRVANDEESGYEGLDPTDVPDLLEEEEEGLEPEGGRPQPQAEVGEQEQPKPKPKKKAAGGGEDDAPTPEQARRQRRVSAGLDGGTRKPRRKG